MVVKRKDKNNKKISPVCVADSLQNLVNGAKKKLQQCKQGKRKINTKEYKDLLEKIANRKCPECGKKLQIAKIEIKANDNMQSASYEFECGHKHFDVEVSESIKIWEQIKGKVKDGIKKPHHTFMTRTEPGRNPKSVDGVTISWSADRKNNLWNHKITDIKTGKVLHYDDNMPLDQHK